MSEIVTVKISSIDANPMRRLHDYPYNAEKIATLKRSIKDVGLWEGIIGRRAGNRIQIAFGHHRHEAARQALGDDAKIPIIVRDLDDKKMLAFMGRENLEEFNADFLVMLETWDAATQFLGDNGPKESQVNDIAKLLGWTRERSDRNRSGEIRANHTAEACADAANLVAKGYLKREDLSGLSVFNARELCGQVAAQHRAIEKVAVETKQPVKDTEAYKKRSAQAGTAVAKKIRDKKIAPDSIRHEVDYEASVRNNKAKKKNPVIAKFIRDFCKRSLEKLGLSDEIGKKLEQIRDALPLLEKADDFEAIKALKIECENVSERFDRWQKAFSNPKSKVVKLVK